MDTNCGLLKEKSIDCLIPNVNFCYFYNESLLFYIRAQSFARFHLGNSEILNHSCCFMCIYVVCFPSFADKREDLVEFLKQFER